MCQITRLFTHLRKFVPKIVPLLLKNRNKRYHTSGLMREGEGNTTVKEKVGLSTGGLYAGGNTVFWNKV